MLNQSFLDLTEIEDSDSKLSNSLRSSFRDVSLSISSQTPPKKIECLGCGREIDWHDEPYNGYPYNVECNHTICADCATERIYENNTDILTCEVCGSKIDSNESFKFFIQSWESKIANVLVSVIFFNIWRLAINGYELYLIIDNRELFVTCDTKNWFLFTITCGANLITILYIFIKLAYLEFIKKNKELHILLNKIFVITFLSQLFDCLFTFASIACSFLDTTSECAKTLITTIPEYWTIVNIHFYVPLILLAIIIASHIFHLCSIEGKNNDSKLCTCNSKRRPTICDILFSSKFNKISFM